MCKKIFYISFLPSVFIVLSAMPSLQYQAPVSIKDALIERVEIFPKINAHSHEVISRYGILVQYPHASATMLICHGFMCDKYDVSFLRTLFTPGTFNYLSFDFRAHGENCEGQCCTFGYNEVHDIHAAVQYIKSHSALKDKPILVYAFSMGAVACIEAQAQDSSLFTAMILDCPFDSSENVIKKSLDRLKVSVFGYEFDMPGKGILERYIFHPYVQSLIKIALKTVAHVDTHNIMMRIYPVTPAESIKKISIPCFFIHCKNDEKVPLDAIREIYGNAAGYKRLWITNGRRHFDSFFYNPERYIRKLNKFVDGVLHKKGSSQADKVTEDDSTHDACIVSGPSVPDALPSSDLRRASYAQN